MGSPAEVDVVAVEVDCRVEAGDRPEQIGANHEACRRKCEHVADRVVLLLVDLTLFHEGVDLAEPVDAEADVLQHAGVVPRDQLRPDDPGVRSIQLLDEQANRPGSKATSSCRKQKNPFSPCTSRSTSLAALP